MRREPRPGFRSQSGCFGEAAPGPRRPPDDAARAEVEELAARADRVTSLLLYSDLPDIDIEIEIDKLREFCRLHFPGRMELFRMVYESRWKRFREQGWARGQGRPWE